MSTIQACSAIQACSGITAIPSTESPFTNTYSVDFDGTDDYVLGSFDPSTLGTNHFTVVLWFKYNSITSHGYLFSFGNPSADEDYFGLTYNSGVGELRIQSRDGASGQATATLGSAPSTGVWYHAACVRTGTNCKLYINGTEQDSVTDAEFGLTPGTGFQIGAYRNSLHLNGLIDEIAVIPSALSAGQITTLAESPSDLLPYSPSVWHRFEEGTGTSIADSSGNGHTATLTNGPIFSTDVPT